MVDRARQGPRTGVCHCEHVTVRLQTDREADRVRRETTR